MSGRRNRWRCDTKFERSSDTSVHRLWCIFVFVSELLWTAGVSGFSFCLSYGLLPAKPQYSTSRSWGFSSLARPVEAKRFPMMDRGPCRAEVYRKRGLFSLRRKRIIGCWCLLIRFRCSGREDGDRLVFSVFSSERSFRWKTKSFRLSSLSPH